MTIEASGPLGQDNANAANIEDQASPERMLDISGIVKSLMSLTPKIGQVESGALMEVVKNLQADFAERHRLGLQYEQMKAELQVSEARAERDAERIRSEFEARLASEKLAREVDAKKESMGDRIRSGVLYLLVAALVLMPLLAMSVFRVPADQFSQFIAPVTGIAGTVIGYWFGRNEPRK